MTSGDNSTPPTRSNGDNSTAPAESEGDDPTPAQHDRWDRWIDELSNHDAREDRWMVWHRLFPGSPLGEVPRTLYRAATRRTALTLELGLMWTALAGFVLEVQDLPLSYPLSLLPDDGVNRGLVLAAALVVGLALWLIPAALLTLSLLQPQEWAVVQVGGRGAERVFRASSAFSEVIANECYVAMKPDIRRFRASRPYMKKRGRLDAHERDAFLGEWPAAVGKDSANRVERCLRRQHGRLQRLQALKRESAKELGIPYRQFCDQVLEFSPDLYSALVEKYVENCRELAARGVYASRETTRRLVGLVRESCYTAASLTGRIRSLRSLSEHAELTRWIIRGREAGSTSGDVRRYAEALSHAPDHGGDSSSALHLVYSKRLAHGDPDPHDLLRSLCEREAELLSVNAETEDEAKLVTSLDKFLGELEKYGRPGGPPRLERPEGLSQLRFIAAQHMAKCHTNIAKHVATEVVDFKSKIGDGHIHIFTLGYSRTVRQALSSLVDVDEADKEAWTKLGNLFLLTSKDAPVLATRLMRFQLKRQRRRYEKEVMFEAVVAASPEYAYEVPKPGDAVIVLIGAKAWAPDGRVIASPGYAEVLARVHEERQGKGRGFGGTNRTDVNTLVLAVGEGYKEMDGGEIPWHSIAVGAEFHEDPEDHLDFLGAGRIDKILTEDGPVHEGEESGLVVSVKTIREAMGLSRTKFAALLGVAGSTVKNWEEGKTHPKPKYARQLARLRGMGPDGMRMVGEVGDRIA